jgi:hypothetical protein
MLALFKYHAIHHFLMILMIEIKLAAHMTPNFYVCNTLSMFSSYNWSYSNSIYHAKEQLVILQKKSFQIEKPIWLSLIRVCTI